MLSIGRKGWTLNYTTCVFSLSYCFYKYYLCATSTHNSTSYSIVCKPLQRRGCQHSSNSSEACFSPQNAQNRLAAGLCALPDPSRQWVPSPETNVKGGEEEKGRKGGGRRMDTHNVWDVAALLHMNTSLVALEARPWTRGSSRTPHAKAKTFPSRLAGPNCCCTCTVWVTIFEIFAERKQRISRKMILLRSTVTFWRCAAILQSNIIIDLRDVCCFSSATLRMSSLKGVVNC